MLSPAEMLIISNYYPPEKGAAANRIEQMALGFSQKNITVTVLCPLPNYPTGKVYEGYTHKTSVTEIVNGVTIKRLWIYPSNSKNVIKRAFSALSFAISLSLYLIFKKIPKNVVIQSPPLLLSFIAILVLRLKNRRIILNVSDLWPDAAIDLELISKNSFSHRIALFFERFIYKNASIILAQSNEIIEHIHTLFPNKKCVLYRNYPNHKKNFNLVANNISTIRIFYAGLLGVAQGIYETFSNIPTLHNIEFHIFGDGPEKSLIEQLAQNNPNIIFHGILPRKELHEHLKTFDIAFVPLKKRIYGSVPSKIFEYSSLGYPILYFGGGEGETLVKKHQLGWVASAGNYKELHTILKDLSNTDKNAIESLKRQVYHRATENFNFEKQMRSLDIF